MAATADGAAGAQLDERDARALTECMTTVPTDAPDMFEVTSASGSAYVVDARAGSCTCPDAEYRNVRCKHIRRARFAAEMRPIPRWVEADAVDDQLGDQVAAGTEVTLHV